jgi:hypothetical protein
MTESEPTPWIPYDAKGAGGLDQIDEEGPPTLRGLGPTAASAAPTPVVSQLPLLIAPASAPTIAPPRHRRSLLRAAAFASFVAMMFVLGWWQGSQHGPLMAPVAATAGPGRTIIRKPVRTLAPPAVPTLQPQVAKPARTHSAAAMPRAAATADAVASAYEPMEL